MRVSTNVPFLLNTSYANKWVSILVDARFCNGRRNLRAWSNGSVTWREEGTLPWEHKRQPGTLIHCTIKKFGACFSFQYLPWLTRLIPTEVLWRDLLSCHSLCFLLRHWWLKEKKINQTLTLRHSEEWGNLSLQRSHLFFPVSKAYAHSVVKGFWRASDARNAPH